MMISIKLFSKKMEAAKMGIPTDEDVYYGPMASSRFT